MSEAAAALGLRGGPIHLKQSQLESSEVAPALRSLHGAVNGGANPLEIDQYHTEATELLLEQAAERPAIRPRLGRHHPAVRRALEKLHALFAESLTLDDLAQESRLSKFHLARCFRDTMGMAPHQYQKLLRLQAGKRLLESGHSVRQAALQSGFADAPHFTRAFRAWLGVAPSSWASAHA
jgi:AraC-like DNA-binding protein